VIKHECVASQFFARLPNTFASIPMVVGPLWCTKATSWSSLVAWPVEPLKKKLSVPGTIFVGSNIQGLPGIGAVGRV
jgi:hypothetical protein